MCCVLTNRRCSFPPPSQIVTIRIPNSYVTLRIRKARFVLQKRAPINAMISVDLNEKILHLRDHLQKTLPNSNILRLAACEVCLDADNFCLSFSAPTPSFSDSETIIERYSQSLSQILSPKIFYDCK